MRKDRKPVIGLASLQRRSADPSVARNRERIEPYADAVARAGGVPVGLVCFGPTSTDEILGRMDGLVLMGGGDVGPAAYGANDVAAIGVDLDRDRFEIDLVRAAVDAGLPLLAVCRGIQVLNVAHGGTLMQDIPKCEGFGTHSALTDTGQTDGLLHEVRLLSGSLVATATGRTTIEQAWSSHHQGVDQLGVGLHPVGWAPDGLVEAIEGEGNWVLGVQWHPETTADADPVQQSVYAAFVESAKASAA